jgi:hypothetical protein
MTHDNEGAKRMHVNSAGAVEVIGHDEEQIQTNENHAEVTEMEISRRNEDLEMQAENKNTGSVAQPDPGHSHKPIDDTHETSGQFAAISNTGEARQVQSEAECLDLIEPSDTECSDVPTVIATEYSQEAGAIHSHAEHRPVKSEDNAGVVVIDDGEVLDHRSNQEQRNLKTLGFKWRKARAEAKSMKEGKLMEKMSIESSLRSDHLLAASSKAEAKLQPEILDNRYENELKLPSSHGT